MITPTPTPTPHPPMTINPVTEFVLNLGDWVLLSSVIPLGLFVVFYYFGSPWKKLLVGRSLMYFAISLLSITGIVVLSLFLGPGYFWREWIRLLGYGLVALTTWRLFFTLRHIQKNPPQIPEVETLGLSDFTDEEILTAALAIKQRRMAEESSLEKKHEPEEPQGA